MIVVFVLAALLVLAAFVALHWWAWRRLVRDTTSGPGPARRTGTAVLVAGPVLMFGALVAEQAHAPFWLQRTLGWPGFLWMALCLYLLLALAAGEAVRPLVRRLVARRAGVEPREAVRETVPPAPGAVPPAREPGAESEAESEKPAAPSRRLFVSRVVGGAVATAAVGTVGLGTYGVLKGPRVKRITVPLAKLPRAAHGFRIAVVSDIHLGPVLGRGFAQRVVDTVNATQPDLIAVVGDLVDGSVEDLGPAAAPLAGLRARHGSYFVTGNHEYFSGAAQWVEQVRELGLHPLENARTELPAFDLAGVNDLQGESEGQGPDFARALGDRDTSRAVVLMAHQPAQIHEAVRHGVDLQLSGHTHGGQLFPGNFVAEAANPTVAGLDTYGDTRLYVTRGAGAWGPPTRVGAPSDITVVELASKQA
ncbi:metallophosphoesterase [Streptomyces griseoaurantiacus]|uniref:metallophosphoesterase n=1 Tax=Streptomyces TaxID=1883 RepID=UPI0029A635E7|nr:MULTISPECIES: metallophosphoesterase [unclassified Streptomyces]MDX3091357.1 metallophosphoesterase [Streptomyces sp. ME12-02E]MDX3334843.1 metallophosphoesterase [Streptomyces sp. ME02-6978a]WTI28472.1 metallophosphoesterase [Streptomyces jietaisiensis]